MKNVKMITNIAMLSALTISVSMMFVLPIPATNGLVTLCEAGIYTSAFLLGPTGGFFVGAISGAAIDLLSGYAQWILFSALIHGVQGWLCGLLYAKFTHHKRSISLTTASIWMICAYSLATAFLYTWPAGLASIPGNIFQNLFGIVVTVPLVSALKKINQFHTKEE